jgi:hypothetical protein
MIAGENTPERNVVVVEENVKGLEREKRNGALHS